MRVDRRLALLLLLCLPLVKPVFGLAEAKHEPPVRRPFPSAQIQIDPRLILEAEEVWRLIGAEENPVWPGWDGAKTPILFYLPGVQDLLIGHPHPPAGFVRYQGPIRFGDQSIDVKNGSTIFPIDGQNTSHEIDGVETLVVADTLSNLRNNVMSFALSGQASEEPIDFGTLSTDPYSQMAMIAHEAFHVYQTSQARGKAANEQTLKHYPMLSAENNAGFALEAEALADALQAQEDGQARQAAVRWLAIRTARRAHLTAEAIAYEDGCEFMEGLATYVEYRLYQKLEGSQPADAMKWVQGFSGYEDLSPQRKQMIAVMRKSMNGELIVNNDPYGAAPVRMRLYWSGMAEAALLDRIAPTWKQRIFAPNATLTQLIEEALQVSSAQLAQGWAETAHSATYAKWLTKKKDLETKGTAHAAAMLQEIEQGESVGVMIDASHLSAEQLQLAFTSFGITQVDATRAIYGMIPIQAAWGKQARLVEKRPMPVLVDEKNHRISLRLPVASKLDELKKSFPETENAGREIDGETKDFSLKVAHARLQWQDRQMLITLLPAGSDASLVR